MLPLLSVCCFVWYATGGGNESECVWMEAMRKCVFPRAFVLYGCRREILSGTECVWLIKYSHL